MGHVNMHGEGNFSAQEPSVRQVVASIELLIRKVWDHALAIVEGIVEELEDRLSWQMFFIATPLTIASRIYGI